LKQRLDYSEDSTIVNSFNYDGTDDFLNLISKNIQEAKNDFGLKGTGAFGEKHNQPKKRFYENLL
jgi:hypothetical protein